ncbi:N-formylglutamate amidohydrolase [Roseomonas sp. 18066]|uniref:N-formylglutamate amidohydrolase n=1 Tax=Roseomonas sp. 18066 TaxID=2681412 RepID=UPI0013572C96|nr:N-formylglutamate amidohydrolase [Roseomonas sp. 18066]
MLTTLRPGVFVRRDPEGAAAPVIFDIPRSGAEYPRDFRSIACLTDLQRSISMYVEECYADVPKAGATWLYASFPNAYIDPNRHALDIDPAALDGEWPEALKPSPKTSAGIGLIPMVCAGTKPLYDGKLSLADVRNRLDNYYLPYHGELARLLQAAREKHGVAYHLSCHSMPAIAATGPDAGQQRSDFDLGDRNGTTCAPELVEVVEKTLAGFGYKVTRNTHFIGAECVRQHGNPAGGIHSLQIEMNRGLYMDETARTRGPKLGQVRDHLTAVAQAVADFAAQG